MNKHAIGAIFAWIFILIAGALIITVFVLLAQGQVQTAQNNAQLRAFQNVNAILSTQQTTGNLETQVQIPQTSLRLTCRLVNNQDMLSQLDIGGYTQDHTNKLITGVNMDTDTLLLFSKTWNAPFAVENILYISHPEEMLFFAQEEINESIPGIVQTRELLGNPDISLYQTVRIVSTDAGDLSQFSTARNAYPILLTPQDVNDITDSGTIQYMDTDGELSDPFVYRGEAMMLAYIWQADELRAQCLKQKLSSTLQVKAQIQLQRVNLLQAAYGKSVCSANLFSPELQALASSGITSDFVSETQEIALTNQAILRGDQCATIY